MQLGFVLFKLVSGDIQMALGYQHFFVWVLACAVPVALLSQFIPMRAPDASAPTATGQPARVA